MMDGRGKSDSPIVPRKPPNKAGQPAAEVVEGRGLAKGNSLGQNALRTQSREGARSALERVREAARRDRRQRFTALLHHVYDVQRLRSAYFALKRDASAGVDGETWRSYGRLRPLGVPALEDKLVQRAVVEVLNAIYETDFLGFSHGFRPGRSPHRALDALTVGIQGRKVDWVLDADIRGFFDTLDHGWLVKFVEHRVTDRRVVRLIRKWLGAGVLEDGRRMRSEEGTVQGGSISPLLANIYLHYVFDLWVQQWRKRRASGDVIVVRFADDFVLGFQYRQDAECFLAELRERFARFNLTLHPDKTRLIEFGRFAAADRRLRGVGKPDSFDFLGFTHSCATNRAGRYTVRRQTIRKRLQAKLREVKKTLRDRLHDPVPEQGRYLASVVRGHARYYGVPGNSHALGTFRWAMIRLWWRALNRRSQGRHVTWRRMVRLVRRWIPYTRICHPYPSQRLRVST